MKRSVIRLLPFCLCLFFIAIPVAVVAGTDSNELIPAGTVMKEAFHPGIGEAVGEISQVSGKVAVIHVNDSEGYWAREGNKLFKGDTIVTLADAFAAFRLEDGSFMSLSPETKLEITKSVYAPEKQSRSTFMNMVAGKTRFVVKKLVDARHSEFKVKTTTSVAGVRGSDFIIAATEAATEVTALQQTELEVISLAAPDVKPTILRDFERTTVKKGAIPEEARKVSAEEVDRMMKEFKFQPSDTTPEAVMEQRQDQAQAEPLPSDEFDAMVLRDDDLFKPEFRVPPDMISRLSLDDRFEIRRLIKKEKMIEDKKDIFLHQQYEATQKSRLPDFPGTP